MLVLPFLFCFAYAAESYTAVHGGDQYGQIPVELPEGEYKVSVFASDIEIVLFDSIHIFYSDGIFISNPVPVDILGADVVMKLGLVRSETWVVFETSTDVYLDWGEYICVFTLIEKRTILDVVTDTLDVIISWCSIVLTSLVSGALNPLLIVFAVPIALALIFLTVRAIHSSKGRM